MTSRSVESHDLLDQMTNYVGALEDGYRNVILASDVGFRAIEGVRNLARRAIGATSREIPKAEDLGRMLASLGHTIEQATSFKPDDLLALGYSEGRALTLRLSNIVYKLLRFKSGLATERPVDEVGDPIYFTAELASLRDLSLKLREKFAPEL